MTVMVSLEKGILSPLRTMEDSFETVKERALEGSDYDPDAAADSVDEPITAGAVLGMLGSLAVIIGGLIGIFKLLNARKKKNLDQNSHRNARRHGTKRRTANRTVQQRRNKIKLHRNTHGPQRPIDGAMPCRNEIVDKKQMGQNAAHSFAGEKSPARKEQHHRQRKVILRRNPLETTP